MSLFVPRYSWQTSSLCIKKIILSKYELSSISCRDPKNISGGGGEGARLFEFRGEGRGIFTMMLIDPSPLWPKIVKYTVSSLYITTTRTTFTLSNVYQIYGMLLTLFPPYSIMFTVCIDFIDVFPTTEFLLSFFSLSTRFLSIDFRSIKRWITA